MKKGSFGGGECASAACVDDRPGSAGSGGRTGGRRDRPIDEAAEEWVKIVQKLGIDKQKAQYKNFLDGARRLGYKI